jgi:hypothetical protein
MEVGRGRPAQHGVIATGFDGCRVSRLHARRAMPDSVYAAELCDEVAALLPPLDLSRRNAGREELGPSHDPMVAPSDTRTNLLDRGRFSTHVVVEAPLLPGSSRFAPVASGWCPIT